MICSNCNAEMIVRNEKVLVENAVEVHKVAICPICNRIYDIDANNIQQTQKIQKAYQKNYQKNAKKQKNRSILFTIIAVALFFLSCTAIEISIENNEKSETETISKEMIETQANAENTTDNNKLYYEKGISFDNGKIRITFNNADMYYETYKTKYKDYADLYEPEYGYRYIELDLTYENISNDEQYVSIYDFDCFADGVLCEQFYGFDDGNFINANIAPGRKVSFKTYFIVPKAKKPVELDFKETSFLGNDTKRTIVLSE